MKTWNIWILKNQEMQLTVKGAPNPDRFWIEINDHLRHKQMEVSAVVFGWDGVPSLLQKYNWTEYETVFVEAAFSKLISEVRVKTKTYKKPSSRERILELFDRFRNDAAISVKAVSMEFGVGTEEVKRDIKIIRAFLIRENKGIVYERGNKVYRVIDGFVEEDFEGVV